MRASCLALVLLLLAGPAAAHEWFDGLRTPDGMPCGQEDCRAVPYRLNGETGQEEVEVNGRWWPVDPGKLLALPAPDGHAYACWSPGPDHPYLSVPATPNFHCIILPRMSSLHAGRSLSQ